MKITRSVTRVTRTLSNCKHSIKIPHLRRFNKEHRSSVKPIDNSVSLPIPPAQAGHLCDEKPDSAQWRVLAPNQKIYPQFTWNYHKHMLYCRKHYERSCLKMNRSAIFTNLYSELYLGLVLVLENEEALIVLCTDDSGQTFRWHFEVFILITTTYAPRLLGGGHLSLSVVGINLPPKP